MSHLSPSIFLLWAILTTALAAFYVNHMWHFDRFHCLNLIRSSRRGAFTRFMTYSYLVAVPLLWTYTVGFAVIKYKEGYIISPSGSVFPKPYELWSPRHQAALYPLNMTWALSWASEAVSHHEELCFWLFLIHSGPSPTPWFKSIYFKLWAGGSTVVVILMPSITVVTKDDPLKNEAWFQLVGSTIGLMITLGFLPILWVFPRFIQNVKNEGADDEVIMRLAKFHDLNIIRTTFRFLFLVPILLLAADGLRSHTHVLNEAQPWLDLLAMSSSIGCVVQSLITLMIFFPRNIEVETRRWLREPSAKPPRISSFSKFKFRKTFKSLDEPSKPAHDPPRYLLTDSPVQSNVNLVSAPSADYSYMTGRDLPYGDRMQGAWDPLYSTASLPLQTQWPSGNALGLIEGNLSHVTPILNPMVHSFTSPIHVDPLDFPRRL